VTEYTAKRARTRGQLLAAGQELLPGAVRRGLEHALGPGPVTQRANLSRQTWYRYWRADDSSYLDELLFTALDTVSILLGPRLDSIVASQHAAPQEAAAALAHAHFDLVAQRRIAIPHLVGVVLALEDRFLQAENGTRTTSAPQIVREFQRRAHDALLAAYEQVLNRWQREPAAGLDLGRIVELIAALADGFALRHVVDPDDATANTFADAAVDLLRSVTVPAVRPDPQ